MMEEQEKLAASTARAFWEEAAAAVATKTAASRAPSTVLLGAALLGLLRLPSSFYGMESTVKKSFTL